MYLALNGIILHIIKIYTASKHKKYDIREVAL